MLTTFDDYKKQTLKNPDFRQALEKPDDDPFLEVVSQQALARLESLSYKGHSLRSLARIARACGKKLRIDFVRA